MTGQNLTPKELIARWETEDGKERLAAVVRTIRAGYTNWEESLKDFTGVDEVQNGRDLRYAPLMSLTLVKDYTGEGADLSCTQLEGADFRGAGLSFANFQLSHVTKTNFRNANLDHASFEKASLNDVDMGFASLQFTTFRYSKLNKVGMASSIGHRADFQSAELVGVVGTWCKLTESIFSSTTLQDCEFIAANLQGSMFVESNLEKVSLQGADLTNSRFDGAYFLALDLEHIRFGSEHPVGYDGTDDTTCARRDKLLNWKLLRFIGKLPFFEVSWIGFILCLVILFLASKFNSLVRDLSAEGDIVRLMQHIKELHLDAPHLIWLSLYSSFFLMIGSACYRLACPDTVQEFSEEAWVSEHKQPRLIYFRESWSRKGMQWVTLLTMFTGVGFLTYTVGERFVVIFSNSPDKMLFYLMISMGLLLLILMCTMTFIHWDWIEKNCKKWFKKTDKK